MAHTYASLTRLKKFLVDGGEYGTASDDELLAMLEASSRRVDAWADRSSFGSGYGPRTGTNKYDAQSTIELRDDLLSITSLTVIDSNGTATITEYNQRPYSGPTRWLDVTLPQGGTVSAEGTWGYQDSATDSGTVSGTVSPTATSGTVSFTAEAGQTILLDSEQLYITAGGGTPTWTRGANGSMAAGHSSGATAYVYTYPPEVVTATLLVAQRRWRQRDSGVTGDLGAVVIPNTGHRDSETSILRANIGHLKRYAAA